MCTHCPLTGSSRRPSILPALHLGPMPRASSCPGRGHLLQHAPRSTIPASGEQRSQTTPPQQRRARAQPLAGLPVGTQRGEALRRLHTCVPVPRCTRLPLGLGKAAVDDALLDRYVSVPILLDASDAVYSHGSQDAPAGYRHHCASGSSEHRPLAHTLSANHHAVGTYLTYYSTKLCVVTFLVPCVFGLCHVSYALMGSFVCLVSAREAKLLRA